MWLLYKKVSTRFQLTSPKIIYAYPSFDAPFQDSSLHKSISLFSIEMSLVYVHFGYKKNLDGRKITKIGMTAPIVYCDVLQV